MGAILTIVLIGLVYLGGPWASSVFAEDSYASVLAPDQFVGEAAMGYSAAKAVPQVCAKLFCYCGCDSSDNHTNLLDCFTSVHGMDCHICQEEALMALRMDKERKSLRDIQKAIDDTYSHMYPFKNPTQALREYREHKLYVGNPESLRGEHAEVRDADGGARMFQHVALLDVARQKAHGIVQGQSSCCAGHGVVK